jgi:3-oxoacyl-[acyl-carrier-protein] synthase III
MAICKIQGIRIAGIASAVPREVHPVAEFAGTFGADDVQKISQSTGVEQRHIIGEKLRCSDLCHAAARRLLDDLKWEAQTIAGTFFVTQSGDFPYPATACILQMRLGLPKTCAAFDINLGCSGYIYGLWMASCLMVASGLSRVLLFSGDVASKPPSPLDRSTALLFGDAGTVTALELCPGASPLAFSLGTDGAGWKNLLIPVGISTSRHPRNETTALRKEAESGNWRSGEDLYMDGAEVFAFTLREVPPLFSGILDRSDWSRDDVDFFVLHQANKFMLTHLAKRMKLPLSKVPLSLREYGNTSSASIPLTINAELGEAIRTRPLKLLMAGFGVGYSWGACTATCGPIVAPPVILVDESEAWSC